MYNQRHAVSNVEVPLYSILRSLLFVYLFYMHDIYIYIYIYICNISELWYTIMYADDTSVLMNGNDLKSLIQPVNYKQISCHKM